MTSYFLDLQTAGSAYNPFTMTDLKTIFAQVTVNDTEKVVKVADLLAYIKAKMPRHTGFMGDYAKGQEDALDDLKDELEKDVVW